jgi:hypothetical protein
VWFSVADGNIFSAKADRAITKDNFYIFHVDVGNKRIALQPSRGMHERLVDVMEHLPNKWTCREDLWPSNRVAIYALPDANYDSEYEDPGDYIPECHDYVDFDKWLADHPNSVSLIDD